MDKCCHLRRCLDGARFTGDKNVGVENNSYPTSHVRLADLRCGGDPRYRPTGIHVILKLSPGMIILLLQRVTISFFSRASLSPICALFLSHESKLHQALMITSDRGVINSKLVQMCQLRGMSSYNVPRHMGKRRLLDVFSWSHARCSRIERTNVAILKENNLPWVSTLLDLTNGYTQ